MSLPKLLVLDDYEGQLAIAPAMNRLRELADVTILNYPLAPDAMDRLKPYQVLLTLRERTQLLVISPKLDENIIVITGIMLK